VWPPEALQFLADLHENNDRDWFKANRKRYDEYLRGPAEELADSLSYLGEPHFFRPFRDARFHRGAPIREDIAVAIMPGRGSAYYCQLSLSGLMIGAGIHEAGRDQLERFRDAMLDEQLAAGFETAVERATQSGFQTTDPDLKRVPRGYPADHPRAERLRMKSLTVHKRHARDAWLHTEECDAATRSELASTTPFVDWLGSTVGPSADRRRP
jgi:uncharacterized protein (TIGR02453 family)